MRKLKKPLWNFIDYEQVKKRFKGKSVALVGSGPGVTTNKRGFIDSHDIVVRINNYKTHWYMNAGSRVDVHYSFYGVSIKKKAKELKEAGVKLCMCKCPDTILQSDWHRRHNKLEGVDFRRIYMNRRKFWFCDTYVPTEERFIEYFKLLGKHMPTTGFAAILDFMSFDCELYLTGFDFFTSKIHNVDEKWRKGNKKDPIRHVPKQEASWLMDNWQDNMTCDEPLGDVLGIMDERKVINA